MLNACEAFANVDVVVMGVYVGCGDSTFVRVVICNLRTRKFMTVHKIKYLQIGHIQRRIYYLHNV